MGRVVNDGDYVAFAVAIESIDEGPAPVDKSFPIVERSIGFAAPRMRSRPLDPPHGFTKVFSRIFAGRGSLPVMHPALGIKNSFNRERFWGMIAEFVAQSQTGANVCGDLGPALALQSRRIAALFEQGR